MREGLVLVLRQVVDDAALVDVDVLAAELLLGDVVAERRLHDGRAAREDVAVPFTITLKCAMQAFTAGRPATEPRTAETTGTACSSSTSTEVQTLPSGR